MLSRSVLMRRLSHRDIVLRALPLIARRRPAMCAPARSNRQSLRMIVLPALMPQRDRVQKYRHTRLHAVGRHREMDPRTPSETRSPPWNTSQRLHAVARTVRGVGWLLGFVILVVGTVMAARADAEVALLMRVTLAGAILAVTTVAAWLISRYADRAAAR